MASAIVTCQLIAFTLTAITGSVGNAVTLIVLQHSKSVKNKFDTSTIYLMKHLAFDGLILCAFSLPTKIWNTAVGGSWPFSVPAICWLSNISVWPMSYVAIWHMLALTMTRFTATFFAHKHDKLMTSKTLQLFMHLVPYALAFLPYVFGAYVVPLYTIRPTSGAGVCFSMAIDPKSSADIWRALVFSVSTVIFNTLMPLAIQCGIYTAIFVKLHLVRRKRRRTVWATRVLIPSGAKMCRFKASNQPKNNPEATSTIATPTVIVGSRQHVHAVKLLAAVFGVELVLMFPNQFLYAVGVKGLLIDTVPGLVAAFEIMYFTQFVLSSVVYALCSPAMRLAYKHLLVPKCVGKLGSSDGVHSKAVDKPLPLKQRTRLAYRMTSKAHGASNNDSVFELQVVKRSEVQD